MPVGEIIAEKIFEMGLDADTLAQRMKVPVETVKKLIRFEIPLTENLAKKLERATWMPAHVMLHYETRWRENFAYAMEHPEIPAYINGEIINQPKRTKNGAEQWERKLERIRAALATKRKKTV